MRTTVAINDELLTAAKRRARERGLTLGQFLDEALQRELSAERVDVPRPEIPVFTRGNGVNPAIDLTSNRAIAEFLDEGLPLIKRR